MSCLTELYFSSTGVRLEIVKVLSYGLGASQDQIPSRLQRKPRWLRRNFSSNRLWRRTESFRISASRILPASSRLLCFRQRSSSFSRDSSRPNLPDVIFLSSRIPAIWSTEPPSEPISARTVRASGRDPDPLAYRAHQVW